ncbi:MAG TPA: murein biosynthesis integral membrane protein MurJ [Nocardioides sp.]|nr:murein biosynthesis integral membrane protein MurJ [Nocardioides sp.]
MTEDATTGDQSRILANSAVMAAGTVVSRFSGFIRSTLLVAALGASLHADLFTIANTVPNMLYILVAGGVFNAVLVPQLVRAMKSDADGGAAYVDRVITLAVLFLGAVTALLVVAAPWVMGLLLNERYDDPALAAQRASAIDLARYCLPQVFFYGMFVLVGQVLNARGRFGPMMWAPIANNVISVGVLVVYLVAFGPASGAELGGPFTPTQEAVLGIGSTLGIAAQFVILVPYLRAAGVRITPRFDFRGTGLGATLRLGVWTVLFVVVNQAAYVVVVRLASGGTAAAADGTGITIYSGVQLVSMVPHSVITVSLATAILPRLSRHAADDDRPAFGRTLTDTGRSALVVAIPWAALLPVVAPEIAQVIWGHGATADSWDRFVPSLSLFGAGLVFFTVHYLTLRGYYALELNRRVFWIQCVIAAVNIVTAVVLVRQVGAGETAPMLVVAYTTAYAVGAAISFGLLTRRLGVIRLGDLGRFLGRLLVATAFSTGVAVLAAWPVRHGLDQLPGHGSWPLAAVAGVLIALADVVAFVAAAKVLRLDEVTSVLTTVTGRLRGRSHRSRG